MTLINQLCQTFYTVNSTRLLKAIVVTSRTAHHWLTSHAVGRGFAPLPVHTKGYH